MAEIIDWSSRGSSPLTRGAPTTCKRAMRLIPAHAGSTLNGLHTAELHRAHPRSRGEHSTGRSYPTSATGSSPLTRGALVDSGGGQRFAGAHPRSRGEHDPQVAEAVHGRGSSPLTRGAHFPACKKRSYRPLIGTTLEPKWMVPRLRGEVSQSHKDYGSSPFNGDELTVCENQILPPNIPNGYISTSHSEITREFP